MLSRIEQAHHSGPENTWNSIVVWRRFLFWLLLGLIPLTSCSLLDDFGIGPSEIEEGELTITTFDLLDGYTVALNEAQQWNDNPILVRASIDYGLASRRSELSGTFTFASDSDASIWLNVTVQAEAEAVASTSGGTYDDPRPSPVHLDPRELRLSPDQAVSIALDQGGRRFVQQHKSLESPMSLQLFREDRYEHSGPPVWMVSFLEEGGSDALHVFLDDESGRVIETRQYAD